MATRSQIEAGRAVIVVDIKNAMEAGLKKIEKRIRQFASSVGQIGFDLFRGGLAGSIPVFGSLNEFMKFEDEILRLGTKLQATDKQLKSVEATIRQLGKTTSFTALEVAQGATSLAQAGLNPAEVQQGLQAVLDLGRGARITLDESADLLANTAKTFKIPVTSFGTIASQFVAAARLSTIEVSNLKESIKEVSGTLNDLNVDLPTSLALINQLGFRSLKGTKAGTTLNTMLLNFVARSKQLAKTLKVDLINKQTGAVRNIVDVLNDFGKATEKLNPADRARLSQFLFNIRGARGETALREIDAIVKMAKEIRNAGNEARAAAVKMDSGLGGSVRRATSAVNDLAISLGQKLAPSVQYVLDLVPALSASIDQVVQRFPQMTVALLAIPPGILAVGAAMLAMSFTLGKVASIVGVLATVSSSIAGYFQSMAGDVGKGLDVVGTKIANKLREIDNAIAVSIFGTGRGRRKRPKSILTAQLTGPQIGKIITSSKKSFKRLRASMNFTPVAAIFRSIADTIQKMGIAINFAIAKFVSLEKKIRAAQAQARNAANFIAVNAKGVADRTKIYLMLEQNILALKKKQALATTVLANAQRRVQETSQKAILYKKFIALEQAYQTKVASIQKQAARKQRLYGKPFLTKDAKELAALGKKRGEILKLVGKDTTIGRAVALGQYWQVQAAQAVQSLDRVKKAAAVTAKQTAAIPNLQALQARGFAQGSRLTQEIVFLNKQLEKANAAVLRLSRLQLKNLSEFFVQAGQSGLNIASNLLKSTGKTFLSAGKSLSGFLLRGLWSGVKSSLQVDFISKFVKTLTSVGSVVKTFFAAGVGFGKFLFSFNGLFQLTLLLVTFGENMRFTKGILGAFGKAFGALGKSFTDIANQGQYAFKQISSGIELIFAGQGGLGVGQIAEGLKNLSSIITNNLLAGMNRFIEAIGPGLDYIYALFAGIWELLKQIGRTIGSLLSPLQEIGKTGGNDSFLSDFLDTVFSPKTIIEGVRLLGSIVEGIGTGLSMVLEKMFSGLSNLLLFISSAIEDFLKVIEEFASRTVYALPTEKNRFALKQMQVARDSVRANGMTLAVDLKNVSKQMKEVPFKLAESTMKMNAALDQIAKDADGQIAARAAARALKQEAAAQKVTSEAFMSTLYNEVIRGLSTLGDSTLKLSRLQDDVIYGFYGLAAELRDFGATALGKDLNREISMWENMFNNLFAGPETLSPFKKQTLLTELQQRAAVALKDAGDKAAAAIQNPKQAIGQAVAGIGGLFQNPAQALLDAGKGVLANGAAGLAAEVGKAAAEIPDNIKGLYGAVVGSFQETRGRLMSGKSETEKQTDVLKNISSGLHRGNTPYLQSIDDKISEPEFT